MMRLSLRTGLGLVFVALVGFAVLRVAHCEAYVAREHAMRVKPGMTRRDVYRLMAEFEPLPSGEAWRKGNYVVCVQYELNESGGYRHPENPVARFAVVQKTVKKDQADSMLELFGLTRAHQPVFA